MKRYLLLALLIAAISLAAAGCVPGDFQEDIVGANVLPNDSAEGSVGAADAPWAEGHFTDIFLKGVKLTTTGGTIVPLNWLGDLSSAPSTPSAGDAYHDTTLGLARAWTGASWQSLAADGAPGAPGSPGIVGSLWYASAGVPDDSSGSDGDMYLDTSQGDVYGKSSSHWNLLENLKGPAGNDGLPGSPGSPGSPGAPGSPGLNGATWSNGSGTPSGGVDGDLYLRTSNFDVYQKAGGSWSVIANIQGGVGAAGADGKTVRNGSGSPGSGLGVDGDFYIDTTAHAIYGPKSAGAWGGSTSLVGPIGATGAAGPNNVTSTTTTDLTGYLFGNGSVVGAAGYNLNLINALPVNQTWSGLTSTFTAGESLTLWNVVYINSSSKLAKAKADSTSTMYGVALATGSTGNNAAGTFMTYGYARDDSWSWTINGNIFVSSATAGLLTQTAPTGTGKQIELVGVAITSHIILFNPNYMVLELK